MTATPDPTRPAADPDVVALLEDRLYHAIVTRFEGHAEAWTTDHSGDTLARVAAEEAVREFQGYLRTEQTAALAARGLPQGETVTEWGVEDEDYGPGCDCTSLCSMGPTCPGGVLAGLEGAGCHRVQPVEDGGQRTENAYPCPTDGCPGDGRYAPPGRRHTQDCDGGQR